MIKATFKNIGPIKKAELELGDLTIIAGKNNTGKTYLVYTLYGFLYFLRRSRLNIFYELKKHSQKYDGKIEEIFRQIEETKSAEITLDEYRNISNFLIEKTSKFFSEELIHQVFSCPKNEFEKANFQFQGENKLLEGQISVSNPKGEEALIKYLPQGKNLKIEIDDPKDVMSLMKTKVSDVFFETMVRKDSIEPFILSAERFGISLFYKELDFTRNRLVQELQNSSDTENFNMRKLIEKASARYAMPVQRNVDFTRDLFHIAKQKSELSTAVVNLVRSMIGGYYKAEKDVIKFISNRRGENRFEIPLHLASSSARGISDLYFYLKNSAEKEDLLIIDEPESHLSPGSQILMARLLAFCVNSGIKVLITTHSDYIIKEINNLIMLYKDFEGKQKFLKKHKKEYTENDRLDPNSVKAYICENGGLSPCDINERGIKEMSVFDDAIDDINLVCGELNTYIDIETLEDD